MRKNGVLSSTVATLGLLSQAAFGQGLDITHQDIQDTWKHSGAAIGGSHGYALGSYTCNIGDTALLWQNQGTPGLAMNGYRLHDGVLKQIGLSWVKHACCVANNAGCGTCASAGSWPSGTLRPGCRDVYSASYNSGQSRLGPRSGINPSASTFSPIPTLPSGSNALARRLVVKEADMSATTYPGALYFAEGVYVAAGEPAANQLNNATYERVTVANAGATPTYAWSQTGAAQTGQPAILAWKAHGLGLNTPDDRVTILTGDVPGDGRYYVASKATDLGNGSWRYDYAVFNLNSHRAAGGVIVPTPVGVNVSNIGFSDVDYHSGEIYDNTDWSSAKESTQVVWASPATFETNPNTNALRWGTMYNFWFTADRAPNVDGSVTLRMFRPGDPQELVITGLAVPSAPGCLADFNGAGGLTVQDIFDYLAAYFAGC